MKINKEDHNWYGIDIDKAVKHFDFEVNEEHKALTSDILNAFKANDTLTIQEEITDAARIRRFLG